MTKRWKQRLGYGALGVAIGMGLLLWYVPIEFSLFPAEPPAGPVSRLHIAKTFPKGTRVTVVTAHPDDAEFYLGATLPQIRDAGAELSLVVATDGDKGYYPFEDSEGNRRTRDAEQRAAAEAWGAKEVVFLHFPDGHLRTGDELNDALREALKPLRPEIVLTFDDLYPPRRHPRRPFPRGRSRGRDPLLAGGCSLDRSLLDPRSEPRGRRDGHLEGETRPDAAP